MSSLTNLLTRPSFANNAISTGELDHKRRWLPFTDAHISSPIRRCMMANNAVKTNMQFQHQPYGMFSSQRLDTWALLPRLTYDQSPQRYPRSRLARCAAHLVSKNPSPLLFGMPFMNSSQTFVSKGLEDHEPSYSQYPDPISGARQRPMMECLSSIADDTFSSRRRHSNVSVMTFDRRQETDSRWFLQETIVVGHVPVALDCWSLLELAAHQRQLSSWATNTDMRVKV